MLDQSLKFYIKTTMYMGEEINIFGDWFKLHFIENEGMAFGMTLGGDWGKLFLSLFRIFAVGVMIYFIRTLLQKKVSTGLVVSLSLILAGAIGNIIDSVFYGLIFSESAYHLRNIAEFMPEGGGYGKFLHGHVVDMLYFPMFRGNFPEWLPFVGGDRFLFFRPVFNIADAAITSGVAIILLFQRDFFSQTNTTEPEVPNDENHQNSDIEQQPLLENEQL